MPVQSLAEVYLAGFLALFESLKFGFRSVFERS